LQAMSRLPLFEKHQVQTSLGISQWKSDETACSLYERADKALYRAKAAGRRCYRADLS
ncbi:MAG: diguanylate cyclase, partial [Shewanella sp.]|nr:diguanylate cyclase [Shewanella sp.]